VTGLWIRLAGGSSSFASKAPASHNPADTIFIAPMDHKVHRFDRAGKPSGGRV
jgi:hypothetical protein